MRAITSGSSMLAITRSRPWQPAQVSISIPNTRFRRCAQLIATCFGTAGASASGLAPFPPAPRFFSKTGVSNNFFYTAESSTAASAITSFTWDSRHNTHAGNVAASGQGSARETATHLVLQIGSTWYLSNTGVTQTGDNTAWRANSLDMTLLSWSACTGGSATLLPSCSLAGSFSALPSGDVTAFGLWWLRGDGGNGRGTYRFDNFTINGTLPVQVAEPGALALVGLALAGLGLTARRRRR